MANALFSSLTGLLNRRAGKITRNFGVATPGIVKSFNASNMTCSVQPAVNKLVPSQEDEDEDNVEEYPVLQGVPVMFLAFRGMKVKPPTGALVAGDPVLLICFDRDVSAWRRSGKSSSPDDARLHDWSSCVAVPGLVPDSSPFADPTNAAALASKLDTFLRTISGLTDANNLASALTALNGVLTAARTAVGGSTGVPGTGTVASNILKLSE